MTAAKILQERLQERENTKFFLNHQLTSVNGEQLVNSITIKDRGTNEEKKIALNGIFMYVGFLPNTKFLKGVIDLDKNGYILTNERMQTSAAGIFAAGDICSKEVRRVSVATSEGTIAALSVREYLNKLTK